MYSNILNKLFFRNPNQGAAVPQGKPLKKEDI